MENLNKSIDAEKISYGDQIVIATNCLYRNFHLLPNGQERDTGDTDGIRGDLALELFDRAIKLGIGTVVCDGGSSSEFLTALENFRDNGLIIVNSDIPGRAPQRRKAFKTASLLPNNRVIVYTQPEKVSLMKHLI